jgi:hypothetical protein
MKQKFNMEKVDLLQTNVIIERYPEQTEKTDTKNNSPAKMDIREQMKMGRLLYGDDNALLRTLESEEVKAKKTEPNIEQV